MGRTLGVWDRIDLCGLLAVTAVIIVAAIKGKWFIAIANILSFAFFSFGFISGGFYED